MKLSELRPAKGAKSASKRVGRGKGSGLGKTAGRGDKGMGSRSGRGKRPGYEGGQMPLQRRIPKRGFHNPFRKEYSIVNVGDLNRFEAGAVVDVDALQAAGIVKNVRYGVKLLGNGEVNRAVTVKVDKASREAARKVAAGGGTLEESSSC